jgi:MFS family permease
VSLHEAPAEAPSPLKLPEFRRLLAISITVALGFGMVIPVLPDFAQSFGVGLAAIGLIQLVFGLTRFSFGLAAGLAVDRFGERATCVTGILIVAASSYAAGLSQSFLQLVLSRGFGGVGSALFIAGLMNRIIRIIEPAAMGRATGAFRSSFLVGVGLGPLIGGLAGDHLSLAAPFHIYATGLLVAAAIAWRVMSGESRRAPAERRRPVEALRAAGPLFGDPRYLVALVATFAGWWAISGPAQVVGVVFARQVLELSHSQVGIALTLLSVGELAVLQTAGRAADRVGRKRVLIPAMAVMAVAVALVGQVEPLPLAFFALMPLIGAGIAASSTAAGGLLADTVPRGGSGAAVSVNQMAGDLGYLLAPTAVGWVAEHSSFGVAYILAAVPAVVALAMAVRLPAKITKSAEKPLLEPAEPVT